MDTPVPTVSLDRQLLDVAAAYADGTIAAEQARYHDSPAARGALHEASVQVNRARADYLASLAPDDPARDTADLEIALQAARTLAARLGGVIGIHDSLSVTLGDPGPEASG